MDRRLSLTLFCIGATVLGVAAFAQQRPAGKVVSVPFERGVYYDGPSGLVALPTRLFMPLRNSGLKQMLGLGSPTLMAVVPGAYAALSVSNPRPAFYLRGERPGNQTYLVRGQQRSDHREFHMTQSGQLAEWMQFRDRDLTAVEIESLSDDLVALRPRADLTPGEYVIVSVLEPRYRAIRLAFDFAVTRGGS